MQADIYTLFLSDFYRILDFRCRCTESTTSKPEYSDTFAISFVRKGNFLFNVFRHTFDSYNGCMLIPRPGYERTGTHAHSVPDQCTILDPAIKNRMKKIHLLTIEKKNTSQTISLPIFSCWTCYVSPFHFSRIFRTFTKVLPHQLVDTRLQHAALMLCTTHLPVADIAFSSGFNSIEYFNGAFKK